MYVDKKPTLIVFVFCFLAFVIYLPALWAPFHLDDFTSIIANPLLEEGYYLDYLAMFSRRILVYSTFLLDYHWWGANALPYHMVNIAIHLLTAVVFFYFTRALFSYSSHSAILQQRLALCCFVLFILHPLNSQPVIYVVQRATLFASLFSLLAWYSWLMAHKSEQRRLGWFALAVLSACCGMVSKEFAYLIPFGWFLLDVLIIKKGFKPLLALYFLPFLAACVAILIVSIFYEPALWQRLDALTRETTSITRLEYWLTQQKILWIYFYKVLFPYPLLLEYPQITTLTLVQALPWLIAHVIVIVFAIMFWRKSPLISFSVILMYCIHQVESGLIPITDLAFEHRTYLPNTLVIIAIVSFLAGLPLKVNSRYLSYALLFVAILFSVTTAYRAWQWQKPLVLLKANLKHAPDHYRLQHNIGLYYYKSHEFALAEPILLNAFKLAREQGNDYLEYADSALMALISVDKFAEAELFVNEQIAFYHQRPYETSRLLTTYADAFIVTGWYQEALEILNQAQSLYPGNRFIAPKVQFCVDKLAE